MNGLHKNPEVSVVVPVYNVEGFIERCVESLLKQSLGNFELILVDDGSTDNSGAVCDRLGERDARIKVIHTPNGGVSRARNLGLSEARGQFVSFVDSDDYVGPLYLEHLVEATGNNCDLVQAGYISKRRKAETAVPCTQNEIVTGDGNTILMHLRGLVCAKLFRRSVIAENGVQFNPELTLAEDLCFVLDYLYYAREVAFVTATDYVYDIRDGSASGRVHKVENLYAQIIAEDNLVERLRSKWPGAEAGLARRRGLLAKAIFNMLSTLFQHHDRDTVRKFIAGLPRRYTDLLEFYPEPMAANRLVARLARRRRWGMVGFVFKIKKIIKKYHGR